MTNPLFIAMLFLTGPALLVVLVWLKRPTAFYRSLAIFAAVLTVGGIAMSNSVEPTIGTSGIVLFAFWLAWVLALAVCVMAFNSMFPDWKSRRIGTTIGAMFTTIPWLGYATATALVQ